MSPATETRVSRRAALASSPTLVGAITTLIVLTLMVLAYNANTGLPFVPVYRVSVDVPGAARLGANNEVRIGGTRVGVVESVEPVPGPGGKGAVARINLKLDRSAEPLPRNSIFRIRYRSFFGSKYLEVVRGTGAPAPEGFRFDGTDDPGFCRLPTDPANFAREIAAAAANGCYATPTELDHLGNTFDYRSRVRLRTVLAGLSGGLAGRGYSVNRAVASLRPLLRDLVPVARMLSAASTRLARLIEALDRTTAAMGPRADALARLFTNARVAFEATSRDPAALAATISEAVPLLEAGPAQLRRQRALLADTAELARRLRPGVADLPPSLPVLNAAIEEGTPILRRVPALEDELRGALVELRRLADRPSVGLAVQRLEGTVDTAFRLGAYVAPSQTVCNYWNYWLTFVPEHLTDESTVGFTQRNAVMQPHPTNPGPVSIGGFVFDFPGTTETPLSGYSGLPTNGKAGAFPDPAQQGLFKPHEIPIGRAPFPPAAGQLTDEFPDCILGQTGYALGRLRIKGQGLEQPGIVVGDYRGSLGPTTLFYEQDGDRRLRDTRVRSRQPTTWGLR